MPSSFLGLGIAYSGLTANQRSLQVTSHNISNANTEGYSRQRMDTHAYSPDVLPGDLGTLGNGVEVEAVKQIRDEFLDYKYRGENAKYGEWDARSSVLKEVESIINEPSDSSISEVLDDYFESVHELNKNPENLTTRTLVRQRAIAVTKQVNQMSEKLKEMQSDLNFEFNSAVNDLNNKAEQIVELNKVIYETELEGGKANDIRDQRNVLLDEMSELADIDYYEDDNNRFHISLDGTKMVSHFNSTKLELTPRDERLNEDDAVDLTEVQWETGQSYTPTSGKLKGLYESRDNIEGDAKGIPYYVERINNFINTFAEESNRIHSEGFGIDSDKTTGTFMFTINDLTTERYKEYLRDYGLNNETGQFGNGEAGIDVTNQVLNDTSGLTGDDLQEKIIENKNKIIGNNPQYKGKAIKKVDNDYLVVDKMKASQVSIAKDLEDLNLIAASSTKDGVPGDGKNALDLTQIRNNQKLYDWGSPEDYVKSLISNLGVDGQEANRVTENQEVLVDELQSKRLSIQGVSLDEEMTNMIKYQKAYSASARMINVMDEMLDLIVNRLGVGGR